MKTRKYLKVTGGVLFAILALLCFIHIPCAWALLQQTHDHNRHLVVSVFLGACSGAILWSGVSFYLFRSVSKTNEQPDV